VDVKISVQHGEKLNTFTHFIAAILFSYGVGLLISTAIAKDDLARIVTCLVYGASTIGIYVLSVLYHGSFGERKNLFRRLDYIGIYFKIAGSYTPYAILAIRGVEGWSVLATVWLLAVIGVYNEIFIQARTRWFANFIYLVMAATVLPVIHRLFMAIPQQGFALIMLGFISYAIGFWFFLHDDKIKHGHGIWHMLVIGGSACHYLCLQMYVI